MTTWWLVVTGGILTAVSAAIAVQINQQVPHPYLDEIFHVPQTLKYYEGRFREWDGKITTPPGLYVLGCLYARILGVEEPSVGVLRSVNLVGVCVMIPYILGGGIGYVIAVFPLVYFYGFLFYTDVWSLILVVWAWRRAVAVSPRPRAAALTSSGLIWLSLWFRQTNIVWGMFVCLVALVKEHPFGGGGVISLVKWAWRCLVSRTFLTYFMIDFASFGVFIYMNKGITLGDKGNHQPGVHIPQLFYFAAFTAFFSIPSWISVNMGFKFLKHAGVYPFKWTKLLRTGAAVGLMMVIVHVDTIEHPFLVADNRHYTFYLWRRVIKPYRYWLCFGYYPCIWVVLHQLNPNPGNVQDQVVDLGLVCSTILVLVPTPLIEFRYFICPYVFWRLYCYERNNKSYKRVVGELLWYSIINLWVIYMFLNHPFEWEPGQVVERFMW